MPCTYLYWYGLLFLRNHWLWWSALLLERLRLLLDDCFLLNNEDISWLLWLRFTLLGLFLSVWRLNLNFVQLLNAEKNRAFRFSHNLVGYFDLFNMNRCFGDWDPIGLSV